MLNQKEITEMLLKHYSEAIKDIELQISFVDCLDCCEAYGVEQCVYTTLLHLSETGKEYESSLSTIKQLYKPYCEPYWWCITPQDCKTIEDIISCINYRILNLKEILCQI